MAGGITGGWAIREQGTIGGSPAAARPQSDVPAVLVALDAVAQSRRGRRVRVPVAGLLPGPMRTGLAPGELLTALELPVDGHAGLREAQARREQLADRHRGRGGAGRRTHAARARRRRGDAGRVSGGRHDDGDRDPWDDELAPAAYRVAVAALLAARAGARRSEDEMELRLNGEPRWPTSTRGCCWWRPSASVRRPGPKIGCLTGDCGACTVASTGDREVVPGARGRRRRRDVETIEGLADDDELRPAAGVLGLELPVRLLPVRHAVRRGGPARARHPPTDDEIREASAETCAAAPATTRSSRRSARWPHDRAAFVSRAHPRRVPPRAQPHGARDRPRRPRADARRRTALHRRPPPGDRRPLPALLAFAIYNKEIQAPEATAAIPPQPAWSPLWTGPQEAGDTRFLVARGYVHVIGMPRGVGKSEGGGSREFDSYDLIEWIAHSRGATGTSA